MCVYTIFYINGVEYSSFKALGFPIVNISLGGRCKIGANLFVRSYGKHSDTGDNRPTKILVGKRGLLEIKNNVGITSTTIVCHHKITIGNNVKIGGGCIIFDTNFHSLDAKERTGKEDQCNIKTSPVFIDNNVFIGTSCIITKGVSIGENSIIAAGTVVTKSIPANEVWGGNPAKYIRSLS